MNSNPKSLLVNSCQYTPVYLIQNPGSAQANTYVLSQTNVEVQKPINNLKTFYENSANIAESVIPVNEHPKLHILKKQDNISIRNKFRGTSLLQSRANNPNKTYIVNNIVLKPNNAAKSNAPVENTVQQFDINTKIVKDVFPIKRTFPEKIYPKTKPKQNSANPQAINPNKLTSVQLLQRGETYHSLNQLSDEQMKMVNQALKLFSNPEKVVPEPTYDPITNTQYIYKVVSPKDLTVVGKKFVVKEIKKNDPKKEIVVVKKVVQPQQLKEEIAIADEEPEPPVELKVTRSGRTVRLPKIIVPQANPQKPKKKNTIVTCFQCSAVFSSLYRLQKHYEFHPTHIPAKIHSNLFHCLLAIIKGGSEEDRTNIFLQQLEQLIVKIKSLLPCLLKDDNNGKSCTINDDVGRLFDMAPGKYNFNIDALNCVKNKDGFCVHNPPKVVNNTEESDEQWFANSKEEDILTTIVPDVDDCARVNSVEKWPTVNKRVWKLKQQKTEELNAKKKRLVSDSDDALIDLGVDETFVINNNVQNVQCDVNQDCNSVNNSADKKITNEQKMFKIGHSQFHSAHFDIRSSPIKPTATEFTKFQINPDKLHEVQMFSSLPENNSVQKDCVIPNDSENSIDNILNDIGLTCKVAENSEIGIKDWTPNEFKSDNVKINSVFEQNFGKEFDKEIVNDISNTNDMRQDCNMTNQNEVLSFLDSLSESLSYSSTEIRDTGVDFQMDMFYNS